jgi:hypothetical protein
MPHPGAINLAPTVGGVNAAPTVGAAYPHFIFKEHYRARADNSAPTSSVSRSASPALLVTGTNGR